jgi:hypothetical protein
MEILWIYAVYYTERRPSAQPRAVRRRFPAQPARRGRREVTDTTADTSSVGGVTCLSRTNISPTCLASTEQECDPRSSEPCDAGDDTTVSTATMVAAVIGLWTVGMTLLTLGEYIAGPRTSTSQSPHIEDSFDWWLPTNPSGSTNERTIVGSVFAALFPFSKLLCPL